MFKEKYIKDNDLIKPDDDFLERLKHSIAQEEKVVHIGDFVDYENAEQFGDLGEMQKDSKNVSVTMKNSRRWQRTVAVAACLVIVLAATIIAGNRNMLGDSNMQADMGKFVSEELEDKAQTVNQMDEECIKIYNQVVDWFANGNAIVYEVDAYQPSEAGMEYVQESKEQWRKLAMQEREDIVSNITLDRYVLTDVTEGWNSVIYYIAEFDNESYVVFGICDEQYIYIAEVSGLQSMAAR